MTYNSIYQDVLAATDVVHRKDVSSYIHSTLDISDSDISKYFLISKKIVSLDTFPTFS